MPCRVCGRLIERCWASLDEDDVCRFNGYVHVNNHSHYCDLYPNMSRVATPDPEFHVG